MWKLHLILKCNAQDFQPQDFKPSWFLKDTQVSFRFNFIRNNMHTYFEKGDQKIFICLASSSLKSSTIHNYSQFFHILPDEDANFVHLSIFENLSLTSEKIGACIPKNQKKLHLIAPLSNNCFKVLTVIFWCDIIFLTQSIWYIASVLAQEWKCLQLMFYCW